MKTIVTTLAILAACESASAQLVDGPHLQQVCTANNENQRAACVGYVSGAIDSLSHLHQFCLPRQAKPEDIFNRTVDYMKKNTQQIGEMTGNEQVLRALKALWPCNTAPEQQRQAAVPKIQTPQPVPLQRMQQPPQPQPQPQQRRATINQQCMVGGQWICRQPQPGKYIPLLPPPPDMNCYYNMFLGSPVCH